MKKMILYFLRHAEAEDQADTDFSRRLTSKGLEQAAKVGKFCLRFGLLPDVILTSPVVRARQTADIVAEALSIDLVVEDWLKSGMSAEACLRGLASHASRDSLLLVGHEPDFSETIAALIGLSKVASLKIRKASLTAVDLPENVTGTGQLQFLIPARLM